MNEQEKTEYDLPEIEIVMFDESDVIRTSNLGDFEPFADEGSTKGIQNGFAVE